MCQGQIVRHELFLKSENNLLTTRPFFKVTPAERQHVHLHGCSVGLWPVIGGLSASSVRTKDPAQLCKTFSVKKGSTHVYIDFAHEPIKLRNVELSAVKM